MNSALGPLRATVTGVIVTAGIAAAVVGGMVDRSAPRAPATAVAPAAATSTVPATSVAVPLTTAGAAGPDPVASDTAASLPPHFADGGSARTAAEGLIAPYIEAQFAIAITDIACSQPPTGAESEQFVCYGLKEGDLVIALRATIGPEQLITLDLIADQQPTTTAPPTTAAPAAVETTVA